ncbi:carbon catabolite repressor protein 4 homolog 6-like [Silene latifolia]|uniref:carbon catabolite repressor protein 4 homolog 6-like n=1 Tax=Silene latifolia TaxID=37657 RepID=UPI003D789ADD
MRSPSPTSLHRVAAATTVLHHPSSAAMSNHPPFRGGRRPAPVAHHRPTTTTNNNYYYCNPIHNHHHNNYNYNYNAQGYTYITPHHNHQNYNALGYTYHAPHYYPNYCYTYSDNISSYNALGYTYDTPHHNHPNYRHNNSMSFHGGGNFGPRAALPYNQPGVGVHRQKPADFRGWEKANNPPPPNAERFIVLSYNILADYLANDHRHLYLHIERRFMSWERRKAKILFELELWSPDIMCFQEVDKFQELEEDLRVRGYSGFWKMRTGVPVDGCAIFFRTTRFKLVFKDCIEFIRHGMRDNVAQICVLESLTQNQDGNQLSSSGSGAPNRVVVGNIHVLYNPRRGEMKLGQVRMLLEKAQAVSKTWDDAPVVLCGDFNCTPKSPLYNFISQQKLDISQVDRDKVSGQASAEIHSPARFLPTLQSGKDVFPSSLGEVVFKTDIAVQDKTFYSPSRWTAMEITIATGSTKNTTLEHALKLRSTYSEVEDSSGTRDQFGEPLVTSYNCCFMGTVDYIWRSEGLQTVRVRAPIRKDVMQTFGGFPTKKWGSDHIALVSELAFIR